MRPGRWIYTIPLRVRSLFRWRQADRELDEELRDNRERESIEAFTEAGCRDECAFEQVGTLSFCWLDPVPACP